MSATSPAAMACAVLRPGDFRLDEKWLARLRAYRHPQSPHAKVAARRLRQQAQIERNVFFCQTIRDSRERFSTVAVGEQQDTRSLVRLPQRNVTIQRQPGARQDPAARERAAAVVVLDHGMHRVVNKVHLIIAATRALFDEFRPFRQPAVYPVLRALRTIEQHPQIHAILLHPRLRPRQQRH